VVASRVWLQPPRRVPPTVNVYTSPSRSAPPGPGRPEGGVPVRRFGCGVPRPATRPFPAPGRPPPWVPRLLCPPLKMGDGGGPDFRMLWANPFFSNRRAFLLCSPSFSPSPPPPPPLGFFACFLFLLPASFSPLPSKCHSCPCFSVARASAPPPFLPFCSSFSHFCFLVCFGLCPRFVSAPLVLCGGGSLGAPLCFPWVCRPRWCGWFFVVGGCLGRSGTHLRRCQRAYSAIDLRCRPMCGEGKTAPQALGIHVVDSPAIARVLRVLFVFVVSGWVVGLLLRGGGWWFALEAAGLVEVLLRDDANGQTKPHHSQQNTTHLPPPPRPRVGCRVCFGGFVGQCSFFLSPETVEMSQAQRDRTQLVSCIFTVPRLSPCRATLLVR